MSGGRSGDNGPERGTSVGPLREAAANNQASRAADDRAAPSFLAGRDLTLVVLASAARGAVAAVACQVLAFGVAVILWATGAAGSAGPSGLLRGSLTAVAAAHGMPVRIGGSMLTLPPLALAVLGAALLWAGVARGRVTAVGGTQSVAAVLAGAIAYAAMVTAVAVLVGTPHAVSAAQWWRPALLAALVLAVAVGIRSGVPVPASGMLAARLCGIGLGGMAGGAAVVLAVSLTVSLTTATKVGEALAPGVADGFGLLVLCLAYLPNAIVGALGYAGGAGFSIGAAVYSPFGSAPGPLPAVPLLAAAPEHPGMTMLGLAALLVPLGTGALMGWVASRRVALGLTRLGLCAAASVATAAVAALIAGFAAGGVSGGGWAHTGVDPWRLLLLLSLLLLLPSAAVSLVLPAAGWRTAPPEEEESGVEDPDLEDPPDPDGDQDPDDDGDESDESDPDDDQETDDADRDDLGPGGDDLADDPDVGAGSEEDPDPEEDPGSEEDPDGSEDPDAAATDGDPDDSATFADPAADEAAGDDGPHAEAPPTGPSSLH